MVREQIMKTLLHLEDLAAPPVAESPVKETIALALPGCYLLIGNRIADDRGDLFKLFHAPTQAKLGLETSFVESFISTSHRGVVRGMHFQCPPAEHAKIMCCISGRARDGLVDLRRGSPTFKQSISLMLSADEPALLYIPAGIAHGFAAYEDSTRMWYLASGVHVPSTDSGVHWDSVGINWWDGGPTVESPIVSPRDQTFCTLADFHSPFSYGGGA
jgi:dTDP-4-dehydrorhamnose 3,5-epimerase